MPVTHTKMWSWALQARVFHNIWTPLQDRCEHFPEDIDESDPWLFRNELAT